MAFKWKYYYKLCNTLVVAPMGSVDDLIQRAVNALASNDLERAEKLTQEVLKEDENNIEAWSLLANIYQQAGEPEKALEPAKKAATLEPDNVKHWNRLGYLYTQLNRWEDGEKSYEKAANLPDAPPTIFLNYATVLIELKKEEAAMKALQQALKRSLVDELKKTIKKDPKYAKIRPLLEKV